ncbi:MAG: 6,7-dimethyl-8-ribityllumazine synthase [Nitrospirae bacterium]|nr:6,7-dimethyl-8-ribityllumazine synthase [Nitrospirota bacterium]
MATLEGSLNARGCRFGIIVSKYNEFVTSRLLAGAMDVLVEAGADKDTVDVVYVPGAYEIPLVAREFGKSGRYDAVICLGAIIRGETPHFEFISTETSRGIARAALEASVPVIFGVLTTDTGKQALERSAEPERNRGSEAARTAVQMADLMRQLHLPRGKQASKPAAKAAGRPAKKAKKR